MPYQKYYIVFLQEEQWNKYSIQIYNFNRNDLTVLFKARLPRAVNKFSLIDKLVIGVLR